jgi:hypothetical protein
MNHTHIGAKLKALTMSLLAGTAAVATGCSKELPTDATRMEAPPVGQVNVIPTNDDFANAEPIPALPFTDTDNTTEATTAPDDPFADCFGNGHTVWYEFTSSADTRINANTFGSDYDTGIAVYTGAQGDLTQIACNDDFNSSQSSVTFDAVAGETYFIMVGGYGSAAGNLIFNVDVGQPPLEVDLTVNPAGSVDGKTGIVTISGTVTCSRPVFVELFGGVRQRSGRVFINASFDTSFQCDGVTSWTAQTHDATGLFTGGQGQVSIFAQFFDPVTQEEASLEESATVRLSGKGK